MPSDRATDSTVAQGLASAAMSVPRLTQVFIPLVVNDTEL
jgi:hypothetical protein